MHRSHAPSSFVAIPPTPLPDTRAAGSDACTTPAAGVQAATHPKSSNIDYTTVGVRFHEGRKKKKGSVGQACHDAAIV